MRKARFLLIPAMIAVIISVMLSGCTTTADIEGKTWEKVTIPWKDYEEARYSIINKDAAAGEVIYTIEKTSVDGSPAYKMTDNFLQKDGQYITGAVVSAENLRPFSSYVSKRPSKDKKNNSLDLTGVYGKKLELKAVDSKNSETVKRTLPPVYYDNETLFNILRAFPLKENYARRIRLCVLLSGKVEPFRIKVIGKEKVDVPAGEFDCYKVEIGYIGLGKYATTNAWYSTDSNRTMVKYQQGEVVFKLESLKNQK